jgi:hypothetical protein
VHEKVIFYALRAERLVALALSAIVAGLFIGVHRAGGVQGLEGAAYLAGMLGEGIVGVLSAGVEERMSER